MSVFSEKLRECRTALNKTQSDVATDVGMTVVGYQNYELGKREPNYKTTVKLADYFNVSVDYLLGRD